MPYAALNFNCKLFNKEVDIEEEEKGGNCTKQTEKDKRRLSCENVLICGRVWGNDVSFRRFGHLCGTVKVPFVAQNYFSSGKECFTDRVVRKMAGEAKYTHNAQYLLDVDRDSTAGELNK